MVTLRTDRLPADVVEVLAQPRFNVAYNPSARALRLRADERGRYELVKAPRGEYTFGMRVPFPDTLQWCAERVEIEPDVVDARTLMLDLPQQFFVPSQRSLPVPVATLAIAAESAPALLPERRPVGRPRLHPVVTETPRDNELSPTDPRRRVGVTGTLPRTLGTEYFQPQEAHLLEALLAQPNAKVRDLMVATHDPARGEDHRGPRAIDMMLGAMRQRLRDLGNIEVQRDGEWYRLTAEGHARLMQHAREMDPTYR